MAKAARRVSRVASLSADKIKNLVNDNRSAAQSLITRAANSGIIKPRFSGFLSIKVDTFIYTYQYHYGNLVGCIIIPEIEIDTFLNKIEEASKSLGIKQETNGIESNPDGSGSRDEVTG